MKPKYEAVVIGVSAGGTEALSTILPSLPGEFKLPIVIVQHMHPNSDNFLAKLLTEKTQLTVKEAEEKEKITAGTIYLAPANYHLLIEDDRTFLLSTAERVNYARPSIDVLFETAADVFGAGLIGVILTGANSDGSQGLKRIKEKGGLTIVQDPNTADMDSMPRAALAAFAVDHVVTIDELGAFLVKLVNRRISADTNRNNS